MIFHGNAVRPPARRACMPALALAAGGRKCERTERSRGSRYDPFLFCTALRDTRVVRGATCPALCGSRVKLRHAHRQAQSLNKTGDPPTTRPQYVRQRNAPLERRSGARHFRTAPKWPKEDVKSVLRRAALRPPRCRNSPLLMVHRQAPIGAVPLDTNSPRRRWGSRRAAPIACLPSSFADDTDLAAIGTIRPLPSSECHPIRAR